jgi:hypothetical protein
VVLVAVCAWVVRRLLLPEVLPHQLSPKRLLV